MQLFGKTLIWAVLFVSLVGCGDDVEKNNNDDSAPIGRVNTENFENTTDEAGLQTKGMQADKIYSGVGTKMKSVDSSTFTRNLNRYLMNSFVGTVTEETFDADACASSKTVNETTVVGGVMIIDYSCTFEDTDGEEVDCEVEETTTSTSTSSEVTCDGSSAFTIIDTKDEDSDTDDSESGGFVPESGVDGSIFEDFEKGFDDCSSAFVGIGKFYSKSRKELKDIMESLKDKSKFGGGGGMNGMEVTEVDDSNSALAYKFSTKEGTEGFTASGSVSAGANDEQIVIAFDLDLTLDFSKMAGGMGKVGTGADADGADADGASKIIKIQQTHKVAADLKELIIDFSNAGSVSIGDKNVEWTSLVTVVGGDNPEISYDVQSTTSEVSTKMKMEVKMIDENTVEIKGEGSSGDKSGSYEITLTKADGKCTVDASSSGAAAE